MSTHEALCLHCKTLRLPTMLSAPADTVARAGSDNHTASLARPHVRKMDFTGRPMKGYVYVDPEGIESDQELQYWVDLCAEFVRTLPPKKK